MLKKLISTGVHPDLSFREQSKIRIFNTSLLLAGSILVFYVAIGIAQKIYFSTAITVAEILLMAVNLWLIHLRLYKTAFHMGMLGSLLFIFCMSVLLGEKNQTHLYFVFMPMAAMIVFNEKQAILTYFILSTILLIAAIATFNYFPPFYDIGEAGSIFRILNPAFTVLLTFLGFGLFKTENRKFHDRLNHQKKLLEEKNKDITDSIIYARRIQNALLSSESLLKKNLGDFFILYKPKAIVSGDFYWTEAVAGSPGKTLLAVCDCTGHGVPGAFMSLLGVSFLNEIVRDKKITRPDLVFNSLRQGIIRTLNAEGKEEGKDGMDAVFCAFDFQKMELQFACANNPLWVFRNGQWLEFRPDKFPIGVHGDLNPFTLQQTSLQKGDLVYLFTDGYADQFGGAKGKKFKYKNVQALLALHAGEPMEEQKKILERTMEDWKGHLEQVDDILIIGIRV